MICYSLLSNDVNFVEIGLLGLSGYDVKPRFGAFQCEYLLQNPLFFLGKILVTLKRAKLGQIQGGLQRAIQDSTKGGLQ